MTCFISDVLDLNSIIILVCSTLTLSANSEHRSMLLNDVDTIVIKDGKLRVNKNYNYTYLHRTRGITKKYVESQHKQQHLNTVNLTSSTNFNLSK